MHVSNHQEVILHVTLEIDMYLSLMQNSCFVHSSLCLDNYFKLQCPSWSGPGFTSNGSVCDRLYINTVCMCQFERYVECVLTVSVFFEVRIQEVLWPFPVGFDFARWSLLQDKWRFATRKTDDLCLPRFTENNFDC